MNGFDFLTELVKIFPELNEHLVAGILVFSRLIGFSRWAPVLNRKEIPGMVKLCLVFILTVVITMVLKPEGELFKDSLLLSIVLNFVVGGLLGYVAQVILIAIEAGADMINMQMGLSSAMVLDPTTSSQVSILGKLFSLFELCIFIHIGGVYWMMNAFMRSFEVFPLYAVSVPLEKIVNLDYLVKITSNVLYMGLQLASPVLLATLGQDIILGVISKTAPQVNVFQLSFLFKPVLGAAIMVWILPMLFNVIQDYLTSYSGIF